MRKLVYTFFNFNKKTSRALFDCTTSDWHKMFLNGRNLSKLIDRVQDYDLIIGIADHNKNAKQIRFDPRYVNKYGRRILIEGAEVEYLSNFEFIPPEDSYTFSSSSNGPCNRSAYLIMNRIEKECLGTQFAFFHIQKWITGEKFEIFLNEILVSQT